MVENNENFTLIHGTFDPADAVTFVSTLFGAKIEYHNRNILRTHEQYGTDHPQEVARVAELKKSRLAFQQKMKEAVEQGYEVNIESVITVNFTKKEMNSF